MANIRLEDEQIHIDLTTVPPGFNQVVIILPGGQQKIYELNGRSCPHTLTVSVAEAFLDFKKESGRSGSTLTCYSSLLSAFAEFSPQWPPDTQTIRDFLNTYRDKGRSDTTLAEYWTRLNTWFTWCCEEGFLAANPMRRVPRTPLPEPDAEDIPIKDLARIIRHLRHLVATAEPRKHGLPYERAIRDLAAFRLAYATACRIGEIANLKISDFDPDTKKITIRRETTKKKKKRKVCLSGQSLFWLNAWFEIRPDNGSNKIFLGLRGNGWAKRITTSGIYQAWRTRQEEAGITGDTGHYRFHDIRHSHITHSMDNGVPLHHVSAQAGHSTTDITARIYTHSHDEERRKAYEGKNPDDLLEEELTEETDHDILTGN